jgi:hypothetical protein
MILAVHHEDNLDVISLDGLKIAQYIQDENRLLVFRHNLSLLDVTLQRIKKNPAGVTYKRGPNA